MPRGDESASARVVTGNRTSSSIAQKRRELTCRPGRRAPKNQSCAWRSPPSSPPLLWIDSIGRFPTRRSMDSLALLSNARSSPIGVRARPIDARSIRSRSIPRRARHTRVLRSGRLRGRFGVFDGSRASVGGNRESSSVRDKSVADASPLGSLRRPPLRAPPPPRTPGLARATPKRLAPRLSPRGRT